MANSMVLKDIYVNPAERLLLISHAPQSTTARKIEYESILCTDFHKSYIKFAKNYEEELLKKLGCLLVAAENIILKPKLLKK